MNELIEFEEEKIETSKYSVPNLERALQTLELLANHPKGLNITEISNALSFPKNSTFRICTTLWNTGYLNRNEGSKAFTISGKLLSLGYAAVGDQNLIEKSLDIMHDLRDQLKETVLLGVISHDQGIVVELVNGLHSIKFGVDIGTRFLMHTAAPSKAMLAFMSEKKKKKILEKMVFRPLTDNTISDPQTFNKVLEQVKIKGYSVDYGEEMISIHCIGAPIFDRHGFPIAAIWTTGPAERMPPTEFDKLGKMVKEHAALISKGLGYSKI